MSTKFILVVRFANITKDAKGKKHVHGNQNSQEFYKYDAPTPKDPNDPFGGTFHRFEPKNRMIDKASRMFNAAGLTDEYNLVRYRGGNTTVSAMELKQRLNTKGGAIMFSGTTDDVANIDTLKASLVLLNVHDVFVYDYDTALRATITEL